MNKKDLNYRKKPSVIPLRSPSPDFVTSNNITPTHSPNKHQIVNTHNHPDSFHFNMSVKSKYKTPCTPHEKQSKFGNNYSTQIYSKIRDSHSTIQRNQLVSQLRKILRMISDSQGVSEFKSEDHLRQSIIRDEYQKLRIQNQTLLRILRAQNSSGCHHHGELQGLKRQNIELRQTLNSMHERYQRQIQALIMENRTNKGYQLQNSRLLQLIRERQQTQVRLLIEIKQLRLKVERSEEYLNKSRSVSMHQEKTLKDQLSAIKWMFQQQLQKYNQHNLSQMHVISRKVDETQRRLQTVLRFCVATAKTKQRSEVLKRSKMLKSYEEQYQQQSRRLHGVINQLHNEKAELWQKCDRQISSLNTQIERLHIQVEAWKQKYRKTNLLLEQREHKLYILQSYQSDGMKKQEQISRLKQIIRQLNEQINHFGRQRQDKSSKLTLTIQQLRSQQSRLKSYYETQLNQKDYQFDTLKSETQKKIRQLAASYNKQKQFMNRQMQSKILKIKQLSNHSQKQRQLIISINNLQNQNRQLQSQLYTIKSSYERKEQQLSAKLGEVNKKLIELNSRIQDKDRQLSNIIQQNKDLKNQYYLLVEENKKIQLKSGSTQDLQRIIKNQAQEWSLREQQLKRDFNNQIQMWKETSDRKSYECKILYESLHRARSISLLEDLKKLQQIAHISKTQVTDSAITNLSSAYEKMSIEFQSKIAENERLQKQVIEIRDERVSNEKQKGQLIEKIRTLQNNIEIYCSELKQIRQLCEALIQQKCTLEKQLLLLKKTTTDHRSLHTTIQRILQVSHKIDDLIQIQVQRQKGFSVIESYIVERK